MADTARAEADCKEFFDDQETLNLKIKKLAELIRNSKHMCAFTGAGISTAAGIADFRSGINTVLDTGTGKWAAQSAKEQGKAKMIKKDKKGTHTIKAIPTASHMALVSLATTGSKYLKCLISQNTDGLHRRSGVPVDRLCELHGNSTLEVCNRCKRGYMRDYRARGSKRRQKTHDHKTGRYCTVPKCGGKLCDTIINFKEAMPERTMGKAYAHSNECDVMLALGSSCVVTPARSFPLMVGKRWAAEVQKGKAPAHHLVIINLQTTPLDDVCSLRIFAKIDDVMVPLMKELGMDLPEWTLQRFLKVKVEPIPKGWTLTLSAVDIDGIDATVFRDVKLRNNGKDVAKRGAVADSAKNKQSARSMLFRGDATKFVFDVPSNVLMAGSITSSLAADDDGTGLVDNDEESKEDVTSGLVAEIAFFGNYSEPNLCVPLTPLLIDCGNEVDEEKEAFSINKRPKDDLSPRAQPGLNGNAKGKGNDDGEMVCRMVMNVATKQWTIDQGAAKERVVVPDSYKLSKPGEPYWRQELYFEDTSTWTPQQLEAARKQREADRVRRDAERAKKRLARKIEIAEQKKKAAVEDVVSDVDHQGKHLEK
jgi:NAD-dependent SIR2 family protein deacetylase